MLGICARVNWISDLSRNPDHCRRGDLKCLEKKTFCCNFSARWWCADNFLPLFDAIPLAQTAFHSRLGEVALPCELKYKSLELFSPLCICHCSNSPSPSPSSQNIRLLRVNLTFLQVQQRHILPPGALLQIFPYNLPQWPRLQSLHRTACSRLLSSLLPP
jgi:hypothetical protein